MGVPLFASECTTKQLRISFARVLIEMDITHTLPQEIQFEDPNGRVLTQSVVYDWVPPYCKQCLLVGHDCSKIKKPKGQVNKQAKSTRQVQKWVPKVSTTFPDALPSSQEVGK